MCVRSPLLLSIIPHPFLPPASLVHECIKAWARNVSPSLPSEEHTPSPRRMASRPSLLNTGLPAHPLVEPPRLLILPRLPSARLRPRRRLRRLLPPRKRRPRLALVCLHRWLPPPAPLPSDPLLVMVSRRCFLARVGLLRLLSRRFSRITSPSRILLPSGRLRSRLPLKSTGHSYAAEQLFPHSLQTVSIRAFVRSCVFSLFFFSFSRLYPILRLQRSLPAAPCWASALPTPASSS